MKKISRTIAAILVLVMVSASLAGCLSWWLMTGEELDISHVNGDGALGLIFLPVIDVVLLPVALVVFSVRMGIQIARDNRGKKMEGIDTFSAFISHLPDSELESLMKTFNYMPDSKLADLMRAFNSMPEAEIASFMETLKSFSEKEFTAMTAAVNNLFPAELASSMEKLNSMPQERLVSTMNDLQRVKFRYQYRGARQ